MTTIDVGSVEAVLAPMPRAGRRAEVRRQTRKARALARRANAAPDTATRAELKRDAAAAFARAVALRHAPESFATRAHPQTADGASQARSGTEPSPAPDQQALRLDLPLGLTDTSNAAGRLAQARLTGSQWRYEHLRSLAVRAADDALAYESQILTLMQMALSKAGTAHEILTPALLQAIDELKRATTTVQDLTHDETVTDALQRAAGLVGQHLVLAKVIEWFVRNDVVDFWIGLFGALMTDVAQFDTGLSATGAYLDEQFGSLGIAADLNRLTGDLESQLDEYLKPLEDAANAVIADTGAAMRNLFDAFDMPLTAAAADTAGAPPLLDVNPLADVEGQLRAAVARVRADLEAELRQVLGADLAETFRTVMIGFIVVPVLAVLAVGIAAGPIGAAVIAAVVAIGAQALLDLVIGWLSGPLLAAVDGLRRDAFAALDVLKDRAGEVLDVVANASPVAEINTVASQLRELAALVPEAFLDDAAALLDAARDVVVASAVELALAAEYALGLENGTAFDAVALDYPSGLPTAPQLPGGRDDDRFSAQALLRDLGRLDQQRTTIRDAREFEVVHRISLASLLGSTGFTSFVGQRSAVVALDADTMLGPAYDHGLYRAIVKEIRPSAVLDASAVEGLGLAPPLPVTLTHTGENRTRVKVTGNPTAPPVSFPRGVTADAQAAFVNELWQIVPDALFAGVQRAAQQATTRPITLPDLEPADPILSAAFARLMGTGRIDRIIQLSDLARQTRDRQQIARKLREFEMADLADRMWPPAFDLPKSRMISLADTYATMVGAVHDAVRGGLARHADGAVSADAVIAALDTVLDAAPWSRMPDIVTIQELGPNGEPITRNGRLAEISPTAQTNTGASVWASAATARSYLASVREVAGPVGHTVSLLTGMVDGVLSQLSTHAAGHVGAGIAAAFADARAEAERHIAKWGGARYEDDPQPAARALGYAMLVRADDAETACFTVAAPAGATRALAPPIASAPVGTPPGVAETLRYRPFENRGFTGTLRITLPAVLPFETSLLRDLVVDVVVRACYDPELAAAVGAQQALVPALTPAPTPVAPDVHRVVLSLRALSGTRTGPLSAVPATLPLSLGGGSGVFSTDALRVPLDTLRLLPTLPVPELRNVEILALAAAVIPDGRAAGALPAIQPAPHVVARLGASGWTPRTGTFSSLAMTTRRTAQPPAAQPGGPAPRPAPEALPPVLADSLSPVNGVVPLFNVTGLTARPVYDVLLSVTYRIVGVLTSGGAAGGGGAGTGSPALLIGRIEPPRGGPSTLITVGAAAGSDFTAVRSASLVSVTTPTQSFECVIRSQTEDQVVLAVTAGTPSGRYHVRLTDAAGVFAVSTTQYDLTATAGLDAPTAYSFTPTTMRATAPGVVTVTGPRLSLVSQVRVIGAAAQFDVDPERTETELRFRPAIDRTGALPPGEYRLQLLGNADRLLLELNGRLVVEAGVAGV